MTSNRYVVAALVCLALWPLGCARLTGTPGPTDTSVRTQDIETRIAATVLAKLTVDAESNGTITPAGTASSVLTPTRAATATRTRTATATRQPAATPAAIASPTLISITRASASQGRELPPVDWDPLLSPGGLLGAEGVRIVPAKVNHGQKFWRVVSATFEQNVGGITGDHSAYISIQNESGNNVSGKRIHITGEFAKTSEYPEEKGAGFFGVPIWDDVMTIMIEGDPFPSEAITGIHQPKDKWGKFWITFKVSAYP